MAQNFASNGGGSKALGQSAQFHGCAEAPLEERGLAMRRHAALLVTKLSTDFTTAQLLSTALRNIHDTCTAPRCFMGVADAQKVLRVSSC